MNNLNQKLITTGLLALLALPGLPTPSTAEEAWTDISDQVALMTSRRSFDRTHRTLYSYPRVINTSNTVLEAPLRLVVMDSQMAILNADGFTSEGIPYYTISGLAPFDTETVSIEFPLARSVPGYTLKLEQLQSAGEPIQILEGPTVTMNPHGLTPLTGIVELKTNVPAKATLDIIGNTDSWIVKFPYLVDTHELPVLGLKPNAVYSITVTLHDTNGNEVVDPNIQVTTPPLPDDFPQLAVEVSDPDRMVPGYILMNNFGRGRGVPGNSYTTIVDSHGEVVWFGRGLSTGPNPHFTPSGSFLALADEQIIERDLLGNQSVLMALQKPDDHISFHHDVFFSGHGTWMTLSRILVNYDNYPTSTTDPHAPTASVQLVDDLPVEFLSDGSLLHMWPLTDILQKDRIGYASLIVSRLGEDTRDWSHSNSVIHDPRDDSVIVSVRHQNAVLKIDRATGTLKWILSNHFGWDPEFQPFLLKPQSEPFEWPYAQHNATITPFGTLGLYDNGNHRAMPFDGTAVVPEEDNYSRVVEYAINEENLEINQVWDFGKDEQPRLYAPSRSGAQWLSQGDRETVLITHAAVTYTDGVSSQDLGRGAWYTRIMEVTHTDPSDIVFDLSMFDTSGIVVYRSQKIPSLYPQGVEVIYQ